MQQLILGTANLGQQYGITNLSRPFDYERSISIIKQAANSDIILAFDTASVYGESESLLGSLRDVVSCKQIHTKICAFGCSTSQLDDALCKSLHTLRVSCVDVLYIHDINKLSKLEEKLLLFDWLKSVKDRGLIKEAGVSLYDNENLSGIDMSVIDIAQLPISLYNNICLLDGTIELLEAFDVKIVARSIFLQGLLLSDPSEWPANIHHELLNHHSKVCSSLSDSSLLLDLSLTYIKSLPFIDHVVFGADSLSQLFKYFPLGANHH